MALNWWRPGRWRQFADGTTRCSFHISAVDGAKQTRLAENISKRPRWHLFIFFLSSSNTPVLQQMYPSEQHCGDHSQMYSAELRGCQNRCTLLYSDGTHNRCTLLDSVRVPKPDVLCWTANDGGECGTQEQICQNLTYLPHAASAVAH